MEIKDHIKVKKVGDVLIFEIFGSFTGSFARRGRTAMGQSIKTHGNHHVLVNVQDAVAIDPDGISTLMEISRDCQKKAVITSDSPVIGAIRQADTDHRLTILSDRHEAACFLSQELAQTHSGNPVTIDQRNFARLDTAIPLHFMPAHNKNQDGPVPSFFAIATNMSEGGLFAEFIESKTETLTIQNIKDHDLSLLNMKLFLSQEDFIHLQGKFIHGEIEQGGIGIEFCGVEEKERARLQSWLQSHLAWQVRNSGDVIKELKNN